MQFVTVPYAWPYFHFLMREEVFKVNECRPLVICFLDQLNEEVADQLIDRGVSIDSSFSGTTQ